MISYRFLILYERDDFYLYPIYSYITLAFLFDPTLIFDL